MLTAVVPAAGAGKRMGLGYNKAFADLGGAPVIVQCLKMLAKTGVVDFAVVVFAPAEVDAGKALLIKYQEEYFPKLGFTVVAGGKERQDSVMNALAAVPAATDYIAVHDGARPFAGREVFARTLAAARAHGAAIAAVPVKNTIKVVDAGGVVVATPERSTLQAVQTPQIFTAKLLKDAYNHLAQHPAAVTDDASVVELLGHKVVVALGRYENIKITTPEDLALAPYLLAQQENEDGK
ncbi:2-C-methyl-D-erythritol 4-phosphate cytidylyltransferase [Phascolarctobacterium sp.]|uniref:2-C-methyl-D-erythritol 4-phosphate cytidylyltransferase n=1 Tax=Phascolarctobacterium sp. TaxID=2049039 RepID=UPI00386FAF0F